MASLQKNELSYFYFRMLAMALLGTLGSIAPAQTITHVPLYTFNGDVDGDRLGDAVSGAGDVNGDGRADLIVGAVRTDNNGPPSDFARVFSGSDGSVLHNLNGNFPDNFFGWSLSGAGDVNGDGRADLIVGENGNAHVFSGTDGSILYKFDGDSPFDSFGSSVSGAGDVNGDGRADLIVGAARDDNNGNGSGNARVLSGIDGSVLYNFNGDSADDLFGWSVSGAGDVNGDGMDDFIVGVVSDDNNGDGSGSARVFSGIDGTVLYDFDGDSADDGFGYSVSGAGDVNGDGRADLIVGATERHKRGSNSGSARVLSGIDGSVLHNFDGDSSDDLFGWSVSGAGDVNGDGMADLIVGAPWVDNNGNASGSARVLSGIDGSVLYVFNGDRAGDDFGNSVSGAGDVNGDGVDDFIVGAPGGNYARVFVSVASAIGFDFDGSGEIDPADADILQQAIVGGSTALVYDVDGDGSIGPADLDALVTAEAGTFLGDIDLSGAIDSTDLGLLLNNFGDTSGSLYSGGDIDADDAVTSTDLGLLLNNFRQTVAAAATVPEPASLRLLILATCVLVCRSRRGRRPTI